MTGWLDKRTGLNGGEETAQQADYNEINGGGTGLIKVAKGTYDVLHWSVDKAVRTPIALIKGMGYVTITLANGTS